MTRLPIRIRTGPTAKKVAARLALSLIGRKAKIVPRTKLTAPTQIRRLRPTEIPIVARITKRIMPPVTEPRWSQSNGRSRIAIARARTIAEISQR